MGVPHKIELGTTDPDTKIVLNVAGLDGAERNAEEVNGALFAFDKDGNSKFTCRLSLNELQLLHAHLSRYSVVVDPTATRTGRFVEVKANPEAIAAALKLVEPSELIPVLKVLVSKRLSRADVNTILGRKDSLREFKRQLQNPGQTEPQWESFFKANDWIFGYGLRYKYLKILQTQAHVSDTDLAGRNSETTDILMSDLRFTKIVELKRPDTPLFRTTKIRANAWGLSKELFDAVSQILSQKASWELKSQERVYTEKGNEIRETAVDVDCILVFGNISNVTGTAQNATIKRRTFELFRRNLRNLEIITYDELFERAKFIVEGETADGIV